MRKKNSTPPRPRYDRTTVEQRWRYRMEMHKRGLGYVEYPHPSGRAFCFMPIKHLVQTGIEVFLGEEIPTYEALA